LRGVPIAIGTTWQSVASIAIAPVIAGLLFSAVLKANTLNQWIFNWKTQEVLIHHSAAIF
jgi:hypothetical protein